MTPVVSATGDVPKTLPPKNLKELDISGGGVIRTVQKAVLLNGYVRDSPEVPEPPLSNNILDHLISRRWSY